MKTLKPFVSTCYSEVLLGETSLSSVPKAKEENSPEKEGEASKEDKGKGKEKEVEGNEGEGDEGLPPKPDYEAGLGARFKFPGDARKLREKSKIKLWKDYMKGERKTKCDLCDS